MKLLRDPTFRMEGSLRTATKEHLSQSGRRRPIDPAQKNIPGDAEFRLEHSNGGIGFLIVSAGVPISVVTFSVIAEQIAGIYIVGNPVKLRHLNHP